MMGPLADLLVGCVLGVVYVWLLWVWRDIPRFLWIWCIANVVMIAGWVIFNGIKVLELMVGVP